jgi:hypothetical protein
MHIRISRLFAGLAVVLRAAARYEVGDKICRFEEYMRLGYYSTNEWIIQATVNTTPTPIPSSVPSTSTN